ncbi:hypothetical protein BG004_002003 [Podila humilis]|nr:hypothetical protein BG004_002003 [Podila humilis]
MTERLTNTANSYIGGAKETIGEKIGNPELAAAGASQKAQAESAQRMADNRTRAEGAGHKLEGQAQQKVGALTGDTTLEARGKANETLGDIQRNI